MSNKNLLSDVDEYGFAKSTEENFYKSEYLAILTRRQMRWSKVGFNISSTLERSRRLQRFIRKGEKNKS